MTRYGYNNPSDYAAREVSNQEALVEKLHDEKADFVPFWDVPRNGRPNDGQIAVAVATVVTAVLFFIPILAPVLLTGVIGAVVAGCYFEDREKLAHKTLRIKKEERRLESLREARKEQVWAEALKVVAK